MGSKTRTCATGLIWALVFVVLYLTISYSYLLIHTLVEVFSAAVAVAIFMLVWNVRRSLDNTYLLFVGVAYLFIGGLDLVNTIAYQGMGVFSEYDENLPTQLWTAARYLEGLSLLVAPFFLGKKLNLKFVLAGYVVAVSLLLVTIFYWDVFPTCFVAREGLTPFKKLSDYVIGVILLASIALLVKKRNLFDPTVLRWLVSSITLTILSEMCFSIYVGVYGFSSLLGYFLKIIAFYCIYKAIIEMGIAKPLAVFFRNLKESEDSLRKAHDELERRVEERTAELVKANEQLAQKIEERRQAEEALRNSETKYRIVADNTYDWEWWRDPEGKFVYVSPSCRNITHHEAGEFVRDPDLLLRIVHREDKPSFIRHQIEVEGKHSPAGMEFRIIRPDGAIRWIAHVCGPVFDEQGRFLGGRGSNRDITERKKAEEALRNSEKQLRLLSSQLLTAQETERRRISRELHDELGGALAVLKLRSSFIEKNLRKDQSELREEFKQNLDYIDQLIDNVDRLSRDLSPSILEDVGFTPALRRLIESFAKNYDVKAASDIVDADHLFPRDAQIMVYRIFQEALTNIGKHARAKNVSVKVTKDDHRISFCVEDDGKGFDLKEAAKTDAFERGLGLATMDERARMVGGIFNVQSEEGKGTRVTLSIPLIKGESV